MDAQTRIVETRDCWYGSSLQLCSVSYNRGVSSVLSDRRLANEYTGLTLLTESDSTCSKVNHSVLMNGRFLTELTATTHSTNTIRRSSLTWRTNRMPILQMKRHCFISLCLMYSSAENARRFRCSLLRVDITEFFAKNKDALLVECKDERDYSHCQEYYLFQVHKDQQLCSNLLSSSITSSHSRSCVYWSHPC